MKSTASDDSKGDYMHMQESASGLVQPEPEIVVVDAQEIHPSPPSSEQNSSHEHGPAAPYSHPSTTTSQQQNKSQHKTKVGTIFDCILCGDEKRTGLNTKPGKHFSLKLCGNIHVTLPNNPPPGATYKFFVLNLCGDTRLIVPKGTIVSLRRFSLCGDRTIDVDTETETPNEEQHNIMPNEAEHNIDNDNTVNPPRVTLNVLQLCGNVRIANRREDRNPWNPLNLFGAESS